MILLCLAVTIVMTFIMLIAWVVQRAAGNGGWSDVFWTFGTGITCGVAALLPGGLLGAHWRHVMVAAMVILWSGRLGFYVAQRVARSPEDVRYANMRKDFGASLQRKMFALLIVQGPVTGLFSIAIVFAARHPATNFRIWDLLGLLIIGGAIAGEDLADRQMQRFKRDPANHGKVCDTGLWAISRHPNYLFEFLGWFAYPVIGIDVAHPWSLLSLAAPAAMFLTLRYASGVPPLEAAMLRSRGEAYRQYQRRVGAIFPGIGKHAAD